MVVAWINLWEAMPSVQDDATTFYSLVIVAALFMISSVLVAPMYLMLKASRAQDLQSFAMQDGGSIVPLTTAQNADAPNFYGCGHCDQVFTERHILEVHCRFTHVDKEYKEVLTPMPKRFAEVMNTPSVSEGVPLSEVMKHKTKNDCWVVINGQVYDLSNFIGFHPGGPNPILSFAGRDASKAWNLVHKPAWLQQPEYADRIECLGTLAAEPPVEGMDEKSSFGTRHRHVNPCGESGTTGITASTAASTALLASSA